MRFPRAKLSQDGIVALRLRQDAYWLNGEVDDETDRVWPSSARAPYWCQRQDQIASWNLP